MCSYSRLFVNTDYLKVMESVGHLHLGYSLRDETCKWRDEYGQMVSGVQLLTWNVNLHTN